ncbi:MAG: hypothetical protein AB2693_23275, partial [Candidatus Thiodiazotropha sp.]
TYVQPENKSLPMVNEASQKAGHGPPLITDLDSCPEDMSTTQTDRRYFQPENKSLPMINEASQKAGHDPPLITDLDPCPEDMSTAQTNRTYVQPENKSLPMGNEVSQNAGHDPPLIDLDSCPEDMYTTQTNGTYVNPDNKLVPMVSEASQKAGHDLPLITDLDSCPEDLSTAQTHRTYVQPDNKLIPMVNEASQEAGHDPRLITDLDSCSKDISSTQQVRMHPQLDKKVVPNTYAASQKAIHDPVIKCADSYPVDMSSTQQDERLLQPDDIAAQNVIKPSQKTLQTSMGLTTDLGSRSYPWWQPIISNSISGPNNPEKEVRRIRRSTRRFTIKSSNGLSMSQTFVNQETLEPSSLITAEDRKKGDYDDEGIDGQSSGSEYIPSEKEDDSDGSDTLSEVIPMNASNKAVTECTDDSSGCLPEGRTSQDSCTLENPPTNNVCEASNEEVRTINGPTVPQTNNIDCRKYDKKFYCFYCENPKSKLLDHLIAKHKDEAEIAQYLAEEDADKRGVKSG